MNNNFIFCTSCNFKTYGLFPYLIVNDNGEQVRVKLFHCVNCGWEPEVRDANLVDPSHRDWRSKELE